MADKKISQLSGATTPLTGTEELAIVQGGSTVKATAQSVANLAPAELPSQSGNANKYLQTNGITASWSTVSGGQNFKTYSARFFIGGGSIIATQIFNDTGATITLSLSGNNISVTASSSVFTSNKTYINCTNLQISSPSAGIAIMGGVLLNTASNVQFKYFTTAGASQSLTGIVTDIGTILIQIYP
jgi:hypothetical protein